MRKSDLHKLIHLALCCGIAFLVAFKFLLPLLIIALALNWVLEGDFKNKFNNISSKSVLFLFVSMYLLYLLGMLYTTNLHYGLADLQTKLSLFIFPILLATCSTSSKDHAKIEISFIAGVVIASLFLVLRASYFYFTQGLNYFFYVDFSYFLHPSYFGLSVNLAILFLLSSSDFKISLLFKILLLLFLILIIVLLSSKLALISTLLIFTGYGINFILKTKRYKTGIALFIASIALLLGVIKAVPELNARIQNAFIAVNADKIDKTDSESSAVRILIWHAAGDAFRQNGLLGVGTGDVKDELFKHYEELGYTGALEHKLNAHNQFLQTGIALGYIGFALFVATFLIPIVISWRQKNFLFVAFSLLVIINCLTESMLEAEAGVIAIAFFQSLLFFRHK